MVAMLSKTRFFAQGRASGVIGAAVLLLAVFCLATCEMGLGPQVDLDAPVLHVTHIIKPDGNRQDLEEGSKLFVGPGLLVGNGFKLAGTAQDNIRVERVEVEAVGVVVNGQPLTWSVNLPATDRIGIVQDWEIQLDLSELEPGEKMFRITAYDRMANIGEETVREYTLLIDKYPPIINNIRVERWPGLQVVLAPKDTLKDFDVELFDHIDYFQNGNFTIRAVVDHKFDLSDVWLNFIHYKEKEDGTWGEGVAVFTTGEEVLLGSKYIKTGITQTSGSLNAPSWEIDEDDLARAAASNPALSVDFTTGRHYMSVVITAKARAGHSGYFGDIPVDIKEGELIPNLQFSLCWYPDADIPRIKTGELETDTGGIVLVNVFDDDNLGEVYATMVTTQYWDKFMSGSTDDEKLTWLITGDNRNDFVGETVENPRPLSTNMLTGAIRSTGIGVEAGYVRGTYRMIVLVRDIKRAGQAGGQKWETGLYTVTVVEEGIPEIDITAPGKGSSPLLTADGKFTIEGKVLDISEVESLRMAWVAHGLGDQEAKGKAALARNLDGTFVNADGVLSNGIKLWTLPLGPFQAPQGSGKYSSHDFSITLDVLADFIYNNEVENEHKVFVFFAVGKGGDGFLTHDLYGYNENPVVELEAPMNFQEIPPGSNIEFEFTASSRLGVPLQTVTLGRIIDRDDESQNVPIANLTKTIERVDTEEEGNTIIGEETWNATDVQAVKADYSYQITVKDIFGNTFTRRVTVQVTEVPNLVAITSPHDGGNDAWFGGGERVTIQAVFSGTVSTVNHYNWTRIPSIKLGGITNGEGGDAVERFAEYIGGQGSPTLSFVYTVQKNDFSAGGIQALEIRNVNGGTNQDAIVSVNNISIAGLPPGLDGNVNQLSSPSPTKKIYVDGVAPVIRSVALTVEGFDETYYKTLTGGWIRTGASIVARVTMSKPVGVLGIPSLALGMLNDENGIQTKVEATYENIEQGDTVLVFRHRVRGGIQSGNRTLPTADIAALTVFHDTCFDDDSRGVIRDQRGQMGNVLDAGTGSTVSNPPIRVDSVPPSQLKITSHDIGTNPRETFRIVLETKAEVPANGDFERQLPFSVEYTEDNGATWKTAANTGTQAVPVYQFGINDPKGYTLRARQIDRAGNESPRSDMLPRDLTTNCDLIAIICDSADGAYTNDGTPMVFKMVFSGPVVITGTGNNRPSITLAGGVNEAGAAIADITLYPTSTPPSGGTDTLVFSWTIPEGRDMRPVRITNVAMTNNGISNVVTGVESATNASHPVQNLVTPTSGDSLKRGNLRVLSIRPTITAGLPYNNNAAPATNSVLIPSGSSSVLQLTFRHEVWPERGYIVVRPASDWHIPPVLTNEDYSQVYSAVATASVSGLPATLPGITGTITPQVMLDYYYAKTTHGLVRNANGTYASGAPDTRTKYVLRFDTGISGTTGTVSQLRNIFDAAEYQWQRVEVVSTRVSGAGTRNISVALDKLADGRQWSVGIEGGTFRDEAGNTFVGWQRNAANTAWAWNTGTRRFWSDKVAEPVIRVNRVTNNSPTVAPVRNTNFRIDCETPSATINYAWSTKGTATIPNTATAGGTQLQNPTRYRDGYNAVSDPITNSAWLDPNSNTPNASAGELAGIPIGAGQTNGGQGTASTVAATRVGDDESLYIARKDYIAAQATRTGLANSERGYEGAFKTVIVYRNPPTDNNDANRRYVKIEAVDQRNGAVTTSGFPMNYNDMSGQSSKHLYELTTTANTGDRQGQPNNARDWIFITWEIVTDFWHVGMTVRNGTPNTELWQNREGSDPWSAWNGDWYQHNFRRFGNTGLRIGNN